MNIKITILNELDQELKNKLVEIQKEHSNTVEGIYELYDSLYLNKYCNSYNKARAYYIAYTLADNNIDFTIKRTE